MSVRYQRFAVTGVANSLVLDATGLASTVDQKITLKAIHVSTSVEISNTLEGWISQTRHLEIRDEVLPTVEASGTNQYRDTTRQHRWEIERELAVGETFQIGILSGGTLSSVFGAYEYEVAGD